MAEIAVSSALDQLLPLLREEANLLRGIHKDFADIKDELESIQAFLKDADRKAAAEGDDSNLGIKTWVKQVREAAFRIEDIIDEYVFYVGQQPRHPGCAASLNKIAHLIKTLLPRHRIASEIQDVKSCVREIKERSDRYGFQIQSSFEQGSRSSMGRQNVKWHDPRMESLYIEEADVVGFDAPRDELIGWLVEGPAERTVISVVGMGGQGKTTLAKKVFDNQKVIAHFDCRAWITVSQSYTVEGLLRDMLKKFCDERREAPPHGISQMDRESLINEVRKYLQQKRYLVLFDDVWKENFWGEIEFAVFDNKNGSRVLITTRSMRVADFCKKSSFVHVHKLLLLPPDKSWELFCKKAFQFEFDGCCPKELTDISLEIVQKCEGLPLAIVAVGGLLSTKEKNAFEWRKLSQLSSELEMNSHLNGITKILALSYDDLPYYLKSCFLYFGMYPEDYSIHCEKLVKQWIAEGFVKCEKGRTLEAVAEQYLRELIDRSLVEISSFYFDGKAKYCRVHDLLREMIIRKVEDLSFGRFVNEDDESISSGSIRLLSIATNSNNLMENLRSSHIRSLHIFRDEELPESFVRGIPTQYRLLKLLDFQNSPLVRVPENIGNLFHLRYLSLYNTNVCNLPKSIGKLQNLETLDPRQTLVHEIPREINKLRKLRHLLAYHRNYEIDFNMSWDWQTGIQVKDGIEGLTSLQSLDEVEVDHGGVELITELRKLRQLRTLGLSHVRREYGNALCALINEMHHLENLSITSIAEDEVLDLQFISSPPQLRELYLKGKLEKFPDWVIKLQCPVFLSLLYSKLTDDPLKSLNNMSNLLHLSINHAAYDGESLHFQEGGFPKLKDLRLRNLYSLNSILIDEGALPFLKIFELGGTPQLKEVPSGIQHLANLETLYIYDMPPEFEQSIDPEGGQMHWIIKHVPVVYISHKIGLRYGVYDTRIIRHSRSSQS